MYSLANLFSSTVTTGSVLLDLIIVSSQNCLSVVLVAGATGVTGTVVVPLSLNVGVGDISTPSGIVIVSQLIAVQS